jgi:hypothetical protein
MQNSTVLMVGSLSLALAANAAQTSVASMQKAHWHDRNITVLVRSGNTPITTIAGDTQIDKPKTFTCVSTKGCLITFSSFARVSYPAGDVAICSQVDGVDAPPASCTPYHPDPWINAQSATVPPGPHTIRTIARDTVGGDAVRIWQIEYTVYRQVDRHADLPSP